MSYIDVNGEHLFMIFSAIRGPELGVNGATEFLWIERKSTASRQ